LPTLLLTFADNIQTENLLNSDYKNDFDILHV